MKRQKGSSIFRLIFLSMLMILGLEFILLFGWLYSGKVASHLNQNACSLLNIQTDNRKNYLENLLLKNYDLSELSDEIDQVLMDMQGAGRIDLETLSDGSENGALLLQKVSASLIDTLRQKDVTGIFIVFNTSDLDTLRPDQNLPGIYIRDLDPDAAPSHRNADLLLECAPIDLVRSLFISTDTTWHPMLDHEQLIDPDGFVYPVFQAAYHDFAKLEEADYGRLTTAPYRLKGDEREALAYSVPLILPDGTVYGVLGVEMLTGYIQSVIPYKELKNEEKGSYLLAHTASAKDDSEIAVTVVAASENADGMLNTSLYMKHDENANYWLDIGNERCYAAAAPLHIYNRNAPFADDVWMLIGVVPTAQLFSFSGYILKALSTALMVTMFVALLCVVFVSRRLAQPVMKLANQLKAAKQTPDEVLVFQPTNVKELDIVSNAITELGQTIVDTSTKFLQIIQMASVELGGYEVRYDMGTVYITDNFFALLGIEEHDLRNLTIPQFESIMKEFRAASAAIDTPSGECVYRITMPDGAIRYVCLKETEQQNRRVGVAEDETQAVLARIRIEYERDYDLLTDLYNRRAFVRIYESLFRTPERLKCAAFVMLDLDNLKYINDTFGHEVGDQYIHQTGKCMREYISAIALCAHLSGDEFAIFLHGYDTKEEIRSILDAFQENLRSRKICLPDGNKMPISVSGGISWYPQDTTDANALKAHADFAMYQVKKTTKGHIAEFCAQDYEHELYVTDVRKEFFKLITEHRVVYHFQPIVSARNGEVTAYEALMRGCMPLLKEPEQIIQIAREEGCLHELELIAWFESAKAFQKLKEDGVIDKNRLLFINSICSQYLNEEEEREFTARFSDLSSQIVVELTEIENQDKEILEKKRKFSGFSGDFALDDYGSGYSNGQNMLKLSPKYMKLDGSIVRNVNSDANKQQLLSYIIAYAHQEHICVIAEGIENRDDMLTVIDLGADFLQGYYLAPPMLVPGMIRSEAKRLILHKKGTKKN